MNYGLYFVQGRLLNLDSGYLLTLVQHNYYSHFEINDTKNKRFPLQFRHDKSYLLSKCQLSDISK